MNLRRAAILLACLLPAITALAGGPRFVTGSAGSASPGSAMPFYTTQPLYFTDPSDLSPTVTHAQADAMVAAAAAVWNVAPTSLILKQGGTLSEHVSSANAYFDGTGFVFPADVQPSNYLAKPIAILYDTDGSLTDLLLGQGASNPEGCRQNAVTESVDGFGPATIQHALILLNGRCIDSTTDRPQQLLQMQYQLMRAFGRVLGLSWSQLNDNVFTGSPSPTIFQMDNWPVMHPIDVLCGPYSYQCMVDPFSLRPDDISALAFLYPNYGASPPAGKQSTSLDAVYIWGPVTFPTSQQAEMVNVQIQRWQSSQNTWELVPIVSSVSGFQFQQNGGNPVTGAETAALNAGADYPPAEGIYYMPWIQVGSSFINVQVGTVPINPLYIGEFAVGAYQRPVISMPGAIPANGYAWTLGPYQVNQQVPVAFSTAPSTCNPGNDGVETGPASADPSGWWSDLLCSTGHSSWFSASIRANHTWSLEATALDESGLPTINKVQPVLGVWNAADPAGTLPTLAAAPSAMNSTTFAVTQLHVPASTADNTVRLVVADQFGAGRPDFTYKGRIFYADSVSPATVPTSGGKITITGTGFRAGNTIRINGVLAKALTWTSTQITAVTPTQTAAGAASAPVDILVTDTTTGATTTIPAALTFAGAAPPPVDLATIVTPSAYIAAGAPGQWTVTLSATQNALPAAAVPVSWAIPSGFTAASSQTSTSTSGTATAVLSTAAVPAGTSTVTACAWTTICATWSAFGIDPSQWTIAITAGALQSLHASQTPTPVAFTVTDTAGHPLPGANVTLYQTAYAWQGACSKARCASAPVLATRQTTLTSDANGLVTLTPLQVPNIPQIIAIAAATGTSGFATTTLTITP